MLGAVGGSVIDLRCQDRRAQPQRAWDALVLIFGPARQGAQASLHLSRPDSLVPRVKLTSTAQSIEAPKNGRPALLWSGDTDQDMTTLGYVIARYSARVPKRLAAAILRSSGPPTYSASRRRS